MVIPRSNDDACIWILSFVLNQLSNFLCAFNHILGTSSNSQHYLYHLVLEIHRLGRAFLALESIS